MKITITANPEQGIRIEVEADSAVPIEIVKPTPTPEPELNPNRDRRGVTQSDPRFIAYVIGFKYVYGRMPTIPELEEAFPGIPRTTARRYRKIEPEDAA